MLTSFPLEIRSVAGDSDSVLIENIDRGRRKTLSDPAGREDPKSVENEDPDETGDSVKRPDSDTGLKKGKRAAQSMSDKDTHDDPLLLPEARNDVSLCRKRGA